MLPPITCKHSPHYTQCLQAPKFRRAASMLIAPGTSIKAQGHKLEFLYACFVACVQQLSERTDNSTLYHCTCWRRLLKACANVGLGAFAQGPLHRKGHIAWRSVPARAPG